MSDNEDNHPDNKKLEREGWTDLREKKRWCTDILFFLILIAVWIAVSIIGLIVTGAIQNPTLTAGNPYRLLHAVDYTNHICGFDNGVTSTPYGYYLSDSSVVCVSSCPTTTNYTSFVCRYDLQGDVDKDWTKGYYYFQQSLCMFKVKTKIGKKSKIAHRDILNSSLIFDYNPFKLLLLYDAFVADPPHNDISIFHKCVAFLNGK
jgi:hypothetical protein